MQVIASERRPQAKQFREVCFGVAKTVKTPAFRRDELEPGDLIEGPAVIDQMDATTVIFPGDIAHVDTFRNILIEVSQYV